MLGDVMMSKESSLEGRVLCWYLKWMRMPRWLHIEEVLAKGKNLLFLYSHKHVKTQPEGAIGDRYRHCDSMLWVIRKIVSVWYSCNFVYLWLLFINVKLYFTPYIKWHLQLNLYYLQLGFDDEFSSGNLLTKKLRTCLNNASPFSSYPGGKIFLETWMKHKMEIGSTNDKRANT